MSESEPQVPLTAQEWLKEAERLAENYARAWMHDVDGSFMVKDQAPKAKAAQLAHLAVRPQEQEAKDAARYRWLRDKWIAGSPRKAVFFDASPYFKGEFGGLVLDAQIDAAIAAQAAQGKTA